MDTILVNGRVSEMIPVMDRGLTYGDGLFETIAWRGAGPRLFDLHMERLAGGCRRLGIPPPDQTTLLGEVQRVAGQHTDGTVKIIVTRGSGNRGYTPPPVPVPLRVVAFFPSPATASPRHAAAVRFCKTTLGFNPTLAGLKTLARLEQVLARAEWSDPDIAEGLMQDPYGHVVCGTMSNLFIVHAGRLTTPDLTGCGVRGIMRQVVMRTARQLGIEVTEELLSVADVIGADELFLTNALVGIWPVQRCEERRYPPGQLTSTLRRALAAAGIAEGAV